MIDLAHLRTQFPQRRIEWHESIDSTMTAAAQLIKEGCGAGTIVGAEQQTAGIGRHGHSWHSPAGTGLYVSIVLNAPRLDKAAASSPLIMLALGLAVRQAVAEVTDLVPDIRWPNDLILRGKKCAGILAQAEGPFLIAGIGINVLQREFPPEIETLATSLRLCGAFPISREPLLAALVNAVDEYCTMLAQRGGEVIGDEFLRTSSYAYGRRVQVDLDGRTLEGVTQGLDPSGFLIVEDDSGARTTILSGGVRAIETI
jgi:BirA family biotin operon repressor/biotin-[acetyl-CoA-carboxylase] ligase